jgi:WD40 repeat protein
MRLFARDLSRTCGLGVAALALCVTGSAAKIPGISPADAYRQHEMRFQPYSDFDGKRVLTVGGQAGIAFLWNAETGRLIRQFVGHNGAISAATLSPDGTLLATGSTVPPPFNRTHQDGSVRLWDVRTGREIARFPGHGRTIDTVQFSPDGTRLLSADDMGVLRMWSVREKTQRLVLEAGPGGPAYRAGIAFSPDGQKILSLCGRQLRVWNTTTGKEIVQVALVPGTSGFQTAVFSPDGHQVLTASLDRIAQLWDAQTGKEVQRFVGHTSYVLNAYFLSGGRRVITCAGDKTIRLWDTATGKQLKQWVNPGAVDSITLSPDEKYCLAKCWPNDGSGIESPFGTSLWDLDSGKEITRLNHPETDGLIGFAPDGRSFYSIGQFWQPSLLRSAVTGKILRKEKVYGQRGIGSLDTDPKLYGDLRAADSGRETRFGPTTDFDGKRVLAVQGKTVSVWDVETGRRLQQFVGHPEPIGAVAFSPDGKQVVTASGRAEGETEGFAEVPSVRLWDRESGNEVARFDGTTQAMETVQFSPDGRQILAAGREGAVHVWNIRSRKGRLLTADSDGNTAFSLDSQQILALTDGGRRVRLWDANTGKERLTIEQQDGSGGFETAVFSPDGRRILTASLNGMAQIWDAQTSKELQCLLGHTAYVRDAYFANGGSQAVTCGDDGTIRLWDAATGKEIRKLTNSGPVLRILLSPDGKTCLAKLCSSRDNGISPFNVSLWNLEEGKEIKRTGLFDPESPDALVGFAPDSRSFLVIVPLQEQIAYLENAATGEVLRKRNLAVR